MVVAIAAGVIIRHHATPKSATDRFFDNHLAGVRARLEAQTRKAMERQRSAWREQLHREALLEGTDIKHSQPD